MRNSSTRQKIPTSLRPINPLRNDTWERASGPHYAFGKSQEGTFAYNFKKGFLIGYGRREQRPDSLLDFLLGDPAMHTADKILVHGPRFTTANIGMVDTINPLVWLLLGVSLLVNKIGDQCSRQTKFATALRGVYTCLYYALFLPIKIAVHLTQLVFGLLKAVISCFIGLGYGLAGAGASFFAAAPSSEKGCPAAPSSEKESALNQNLLSNAERNDFDLFHQGIAERNDFDLFHQGNAERNDFAPFQDVFQKEAVDKQRATLTM